MKLPRRPLMTMGSTTLANMTIIMISLPRLLCLMPRGVMTLVGNDCQRGSCFA